ncbi:GntR family transcriptional regulator [Streptomyces acidiscabies]|uniref:GntR family transcriptional regulator n=1 Tax=Streptomyces acidiscabies TaxID=42234 RepID=UPI0009514CD4|nr:GntR family transcriptional regulator [Streptomyces acidiscabies]
MEKTTRTGADAVGPDDRITTPADWEQALDSLPAAWPKSLQAQAADPVVRAAVRRAYTVGLPVAEIRRRTGRSFKALRLILSLEGVLRASGGRGLRPGLPEGYPTWSAYTTAVIRRRIAEGTYPAATPLPPHRALASELTVSRSAVCAAVRRLKGEGRLRREGRRLVVEGPAGRPVAHRPAAATPPVGAGGRTGPPRAPGPADRARPPTPPSPRFSPSHLAEELPDGHR